MAQRKEDRQRALQDYYSQLLLQYYGPQWDVLSSAPSSLDYPFAPFPDPNHTTQINSPQQIIYQQFRNLGMMRPFAPQSYQPNYSTFVSEIL